MKEAASLIALAVMLHVPRALAHEEGAPFSGAIIDPPVLHHAHIENEQRINLFVLRGVRDGPGRRQTGYEAELELAYARQDFRYGFEVFIPVSRLPSKDGGRETEIGDIEVRPVKYSLYLRPDAVISTATAIGFPTGSNSGGLRDGNTSLAQLLFADKASGNWATGVNLGVGGNVRGEEESWFEYGVGLSYSFIRAVRFGELAPPRPSQAWVLAPSVELVGETILRGEAAGEQRSSVIPGLTLWHPRTGWQARLGMAFPISDARDADRTFLVQVGNHRDWGSLF